MASGRKPTKKKIAKKKAIKKRQAIKKKLGNPNFNTELFQSIKKKSDGTPALDQNGKPIVVNDITQMWKDYGNGGKAKLVAGKHDDPRIFFDRNGCLHIVLDSDDWEEKVKKHRIPRGDRNHKTNNDAGFRQGNGIYVHVTSSSPVDNVCPCKLLPNDPCNPG